MATITWLHLSDLHFKSVDFEQYNQGVVLDALWRDIDRLKKDKGLKPDFIIFTGDITYHGAKDEYELARELFFEPLLYHAGIGKDRLFVVPGNHDVDWSKVDKMQIAGMGELLQDRNEIVKFQGSPASRKRFFEKLEMYSWFVSSYLGANLTGSAGEYFYSQVVDIKGCKIAVLGLNSAWMSPRGHNNTEVDRGNLLIGERQIGDALSRVPQADLYIAALHHPLEWLHDIERPNIEGQLTARCDFILHGHVHVPQVSCRTSLSGQVIHIPAGAIYTDRGHWLGYNLVQFDPNAKRGWVYFRRYNDQGPTGPEWVKDILATGEELDGKVEVSLLGEKPLAGPADGDAKYRVLLVDDQLNWQKMVQDLLFLPEFDLQIAPSYKDAMVRLNEKFDLVVVNLCLKNNTDFQGQLVLDELGKHTIPCIVLTGTSIQIGGIFKRYPFVSDVFIKAKNFNDAAFLQCVRSALPK
jgi:predicted MPP superfamily phosphohydrolase